MKNMITKWILPAICVVCLLFSVPVDAAEHNTLSKQETSDGWELLFDGKKLDGWILSSTKKPLTGKKWAIKDEALTLVRPAGGALHCAYTSSKYKNFEFLVEWKTQGNSGLLFRMDPSYKGKIWHKAFEMQIEKDTDLMKSTSAGGIYDLYDFTKKKIIHPDGWNKTRVRCLDNHFTFWLNGKMMHDFTIGSKDWKRRVAKSKFKKFDDFAMFENGHIAFQDHKARVQFRNIKIKKLKSKMKNK